MLTQSQLKAVLFYDPLTGAFRWLKQRRGCAKDGVAGCINNVGYSVIRIDGMLYLAHRLAWLYVTGEWPKIEVDHENRIRDDNRWSNLRSATVSQNRVNRLVSKNNKLGIKGVNQIASGFTAFICVESKMKYLGTFPTAEEAAKVFDKAHQELHGDFSPKA